VIDYDNTRSVYENASRLGLTMHQMYAQLPEKPATIASELETLDSRPTIEDFQDIAERLKVRLTSVQSIAANMGLTARYVPSKDIDWDAVMADYNSNGYRLNYTARKYRVHPHEILTRIG